MGKSIDGGLCNNRSIDGERICWIHALGPGGSLLWAAQAQVALEQGRCAEYTDYAAFERDVAEVIARELNEWIGQMSGSAATSIVTANLPDHYTARTA
jgi:hypothetical protein